MDAFTAQDSSSMMQGKGTNTYSALPLAGKKLYYVPGQHFDFNSTLDAFVALTNAQVINADTLPEPFCRDACDQVNCYNQITSVYTSEQSDAYTRALYYFGCSLDSMDPDTLGVMISNFDGLQLFLKSSIDVMKDGPGLQYSRPYEHDYAPEVTHALLMAGANMSVDLAFTKPPHVAELEAGKSADISDSSSAFLSQSLILVPLATTMSAWVYVVSAMTIVAEERRLKLRNHLRMIGVPGGVYLCSIMLSESVVAIVGLCLSLLPAQSFSNAWYTNVSPALLVLIYIGLALNAVVNGVFIATLAHKAPRANGLMALAFLCGASAGSVAGVYCGFQFSPFVGWFSSLGFIQQFGVFVASSRAVKQAGGYLSWHKFWTLRDSCNGHDWLPEFPNYYQTLWVHFVIFAVVLPVMGWLLVVYIDAVWPGEYGVRRKPGFFLSRRFWFGSSSIAAPVVDIESYNRDNLNTVLPSLDSDINAEVRSVLQDVRNQGNKYALQAIKLGKVYRKQKSCIKWGKSSSAHDANALDGLTLGGKEGECLVLVAHNGGGKSTLINILSGLIEPSFGDAFIYGKSILSDIDDVRKMAGAVPQENLLWDGLSCVEHVYMFARLRGAGVEEARQVALQRLETMGLLEDQHALARELSGGMKRRLCFAMAIATNPKVLFLDEVTAGTDPVSKAHIFSAISHLKRQGTMIVMVTHDLTEAEQLSDKVALLALGRLRAVGSVFHLKQRFGLGYCVEVSVVPGQDTTIKQIGTLLSETGELVEQDVSGYFTVMIPLHALTRLRDVLQVLEKNTHGDVKDWTVSESTLESVFVRVTHGSPETAIKAPAEASAEVGKNGDAERDIISYDGKVTLNLLWEGEEDDIVASVSVPVGSTYGQLRRALLRGNLMPATVSFAFVAVPQRRNEESEYVPRNSPVVYVREVSDDEVSQEVLELRRELAQAEADIASTKEEIAELKKRLALLA